MKTNGGKIVFRHNDKAVLNIGLRPFWQVFHHTLQEKSIVMHKNDLILLMPLQPRIVRRPLYGLLTPLLIALIYLVIINHPAQADSIFESRARIMQIADEYIHHMYDQHYEITVDFSYRDSGLHVARCKQPLEAFFPANMQNVIASSVGIHCPYPNWQVFLPVQIQAYTQVLIASRPLARNTVISDVDITRGNREISQYHSGVFIEKQKLVGMVLKQPLTKGSVFTSRQLAPTHLLHLSEPANIMTQTSGVTERAQSEDLMDGKSVQKFQISNTNTGRRLTAEVMTTSTARIKM